MATNKQLVKLANELPVLAKAYYSHLSGTPEEIAKKQQKLLKVVQQLHKQLRAKGSDLVKVPKPATKASKARRATAVALAFEDSGCPPGMKQCPDGTCVPENGGDCGTE